MPNDGCNFNPNAVDNAATNPAAYEQQHDKNGEVNWYLTHFVRNVEFLTNSTLLASVANLRLSIEIIEKMEKDPEYNEAQLLMLGNIRSALSKELNDRKAS